MRYYRNTFGKSSNDDWNHFCLFKAVTGSVNSNLPSGGLGSQGPNCKKSCFSLVWFRLLNKKPISDKKLYLVHTTILDIWLGISRALSQITLSTKGWLFRRARKLGFSCNTQDFFLNPNENIWKIIVYSTFIFLIAMLKFICIVSFFLILLCEMLLLVLFDTERNCSSQENSIINWW